jgi:hypothetical protein
MSYTDHPTLKVGDRVRCLKTVKFVDGGQHTKEDILLVEESTLAYYRFFTPKQYEVVL